jgi:hypothetical protein
MYAPCQGRERAGCTDPVPRVWWRHFGVSLNRLNEIVLGKRGITADTALRLGRFLKTSPQLGFACRETGICTRRCCGRLGEPPEPDYPVLVLYLILRFLVDLVD